MTEAAVGKLVLVDAAGGALASLGAAVARSLGLDASAATTASVAPASADVATVLEEVRMGAPVPATPFEAASAAGRRVVFLGPGDPPPAIGAASSCRVALYQGPDRTDFGEATLERLALLRIARDRVERLLSPSG